jgi:hypothetical protein
MKNRISILGGVQGFFSRSLHDDVFWAQPTSYPKSTVVAGKGISSRVKRLRNAAY